MSKIRIEDIKEEAAAAGWIVLSTEYINLDTEMQFECSEGHKVNAPWKKIRGKFECPVCKNQNYTNAEIASKKKGGQRLLALDQASHTTGWAVFDNDKLVKCGAFNTQKSEEVDRYEAIRHWLLSMIANWRPDFIAIEGIQYQEEEGTKKMGVTVFQTLARLQGVIMITCKEAKIPFEICPTNTWRHYCGVKGRSRIDKKKSMQILVKNWYDISVSDDESDAIGIGYYAVNNLIKKIVVENWEI